MSSFGLIRILLILRLVAPSVMAVRLSSRTSRFVHVRRDNQVSSLFQKKNRHHIHKEKRLSSTCNASESIPWMDDQDMMWEYEEEEIHDDEWHFDEEWEDIYDRYGGLEEEEDEEDEEKRVHLVPRPRYVENFFGTSYHQNWAEQPNFLLPRHMKPGQVEPLLWRHTSEAIDDDEIFAVGLPPQLLTEFRHYLEQEAGLLELVHQMLYNKINRNNNNKTSTPKKNTATQPPMSYEKEESQVWKLKDGHKWSVKRANHWDTDMVWFDPADEACYERLRSVLRRGNFEMVMEAVRQQLGLPPNRLVVHGLGAIFLSHFATDPPLYSHLHRDVPDTRGAFYNILVPIYLPEHHATSLYVGGQDGVCAPLHLQYNVATVVGSDSWHGTGECDYRSHQEFRLSMSIWVSEITPENAHVIATDGTSPWPLHGDTDWYLAQEGRSLHNDTGRDPALPTYEDQRPDCAWLRHHCDTDVQHVRKLCPRTCNVYMEYPEYASYFNNLLLQEEQQQQQDIQQTD